MTLNAIETLIIVSVITLGTVITRALPFLCFPASRETPRYIVYLGKVLPYSVIGLLVVYCLKTVNVSVSPFGIPEAAAILLIAVLHIWKHNPLISIGIGTAVYMLLIQLVFI